jgi:DNA-binding NtrC family response regulator
VNARFLAATHRDLRRMVNEREFREDLYFRLAVLPVRVPPLRDRLEDLPRLIDRFAPKMAPVLRQQLQDKLQGRKLAGNVRELRNVVERTLLLGRPDVEDLDTSPSESDAPSANSADASAAMIQGTFHEFQEASERDYLRAILVKHEGHVADAAQAAGVNRTYFYRLLKKHGL